VIIGKRESTAAYPGTTVGPITKVREIGVSLLFADGIEMLFQIGRINLMAVENIDSLFSVMPVRCYAGQSFDIVRKPGKAASSVRLPVP